MCVPFLNERYCSNFLGCNNRGPSEDWGGVEGKGGFSLVSLCPESAEQTLLVLVTSMNSRPKAKRYGRTVPDKSTRAENLLIFFSDTGMPFPFLSPDILTFYR